MLIQFVFCFFLSFLLFAFPFSHFLVDAHYRPQKTMWELMQCGDYVFIHTQIVIYFFFSSFFFFAIFDFILFQRETVEPHHTKDPHRQANNRNCINIYANSNTNISTIFVCLSCACFAVGFFFFGTIFAFVFIALI